jgi:hypothetical protein
MPLFTKQLNKESMDSNKFFSLKRFSRFFCTDLRLNQKYYLFCFAGLAIGIYLILLFNMLNSRDFKDFQYTRLFGICILGLFAFVGDAFKDLSSKTKTDNYLLLPASTFEKILSQFLIRFVLGSFLFLLLFWVDAHLARWTMMQLEPFRLGDRIIDRFHFSCIIAEASPFYSKAFIISVYTLSTLSVGAFLFAGRLFFRRFALIKTVITFIALFFIVICSMSLLTHLFFPERANEFFSFPPKYKVTEYLVNYQAYFYPIFCFSWLLLLPLVYFKLKEKQA